MEAPDGGLKAVSLVVHRDRHLERGLRRARRMLHALEGPGGHAGPFRDPPVDGAQQQGSGHVSPRPLATIGKENLTCVGSGLIEEDGSAVYEIGERVIGVPGGA